jgi:hypothetical protein
VQKVVSLSLLKVTNKAIHDPLRLCLQQVLEVDILLIRHIRKTILAVNFCTSLVEVLAHGKVFQDGGQTGGDAVVLLLLLHARDCEHL